MSINTYNTVGLRRISFFSEIRSPRSVTPFCAQPPPSPPKQNSTAAQPLSACIGKMRNRIMMGQARQISDDLNDYEEQDRHAAGYSDEPMRETYLPSSIHGSPRHMAALAKMLWFWCLSLDARICS